jgi:RNA polymerase sigma-70 factor (ECF subfamily)
LPRQRGRFTGKAFSAQHKFEISLSPEFNACAALAPAINLSHHFSFFSIIGIEPMSIEKDVVSRAVKGDGQAFAQLYEENFDRIYRYVYLRLGNQAEAEDLSQEVFAKAFEAMGSYKWRNLPFASWLFRIAHNQIVDFLRKQTKVKEVALDDDNVTVAGEANPAFIAEKELEIEELIDGVKKLSPAQREVISLRFGAELSIAEAARVLGKSPGTVKALQYNGIVALRKMLLGNR